MAKKRSDPSEEKVNPYASPQSTSSPARSAAAAPRSSKFPGIWRDGDMLVMEKTSRLPNRCLKSNDVENLRPLTRRHTSHHWSLFLVLLLFPVLFVWDVRWPLIPGRIGLVVSRAEPIPSFIAVIAVYGLLVLVLGKSADVTIALNRRWRQRRTERILISSLLILSMFILGGLGFFYLAVGSLAAGILAGVWAARIGAPSRITRKHVWFRGVHPDFLAMFPEWPG